MPSRASDRVSFGVAYYRLGRRLLASGTGVLDGLIEARARERVVFYPESQHTPR
jgi:hypothetical protein